MGERARLLLCPGILLGVGLLWGPAAMGREGDGTWVVDDDRVQCPQADFTSIQAAVAAADAFDHIRVCPGLYRESVTVDKPLRLRGAGPAVEERTADPLREAVVQPPSIPGYGFLLSASHVRLEGFTVVGDGRFPGTFGVALAPSQGAEDVRANYLTRHDTALSASSGPPSLVAGNRVEQSHEGVALFGSSATTVEGNLFQRSNNALELLGTQGVVAFGNRFEGCERALQGSKDTDSVISLNRVGGGPITNTGIFLSGSHAPRVALNEVVDQSFTDGPFLPTGIRLEGVTGAHLWGNFTARNVGDGVLLSAAMDNEVGHNESVHNGRDGMRLEGSSHNLLVENRLRDNGVFDAEDDLRPTNTWERTSCRTDAPPGTICQRP